MGSNPQWPKGGPFSYGVAVERSPHADGRPPAYRFPGRVCGWYDAGGGRIGYCVSREGDPGNIQIFPAGMLRLRDQ